MTTREEQLLEDSKSLNIDTSIEAVVNLCKEFLFPRSEYEKAEYLLFEKVGFQVSTHGYILEITLAEGYFKMGEISRAKRFLETALLSSLDSVRDKASQLREKIEELE